MLAGGENWLGKSRMLRTVAAAERVDRLRVVADHGQAVAAGLQRQQDRRLQPVGVLIFVDENVIEAAADIVGQRRIAHGLRPVEQQVVVIEHVLLLLGLDIGREQFLQLGRPARAPRKEMRRAPARSRSRR